VIDQQSIDNTTHFNQLLPLSTIASKTRYLTCRDSAHPAQTDLRHPALETAPGHGAGSGAAQILIYDFDFAPTQLAQMFPHRVLQFLAF
jgi:hypothetical protein